MTKDEILSCLCYYDKRNPNCEDDENIEMHNKDLKKSNRASWCGCDNCFHGKAELANELLKYIK